MFHTMNLKERGITVGDLLILLIIIFTTTILFKSFKKDKKITLYDSYLENISNRSVSFSKIYLNNSFVKNKL